MLNALKNFITPAAEVASSESETKFRVFPNQGECTVVVSKDAKASKGSHLATTLKPYRKYQCTEVLQGTDFTKGNIHATTNNGFVTTVINCYNGHHNLIIRPDDIWAAIMVQFSLYINANSEKYLDKFVSFDGKKELCVAIPGTLHNAPYDQFVQLMTHEIDQNLVDKEVKEWILPNFTTTTEDDRVTFGSIFMASMKKYFEFKCCLMCGIPWITLLGTRSDWEILLAKLEKLKSYDLHEWCGMLEPICQQFVSAKEGKIDLKFWQSICHYESGGSGSPTISGWITSFCAFDEDGKWLHHPEYSFRDVGYLPSKHPLSGGGGNGNWVKWPTMDISKVPSGVVEADVKIVDVDGQEYKSLLLAGHMAYEILPDGVTLQPKLGWVIALKSKDTVDDEDLDPSELMSRE